MWLNCYEHFHWLTMTCQTAAQQSLVIVLHTSVQTMLKRTGMQNLIKLYHVGSLKSYEHLTTTCQTYLWQSLVTVLHSSVSTMLKFISIQNLIKIYGLVQEYWAFSLKDLDQPKRCSAKPRHHFAYQWLGWNNAQQTLIHQKRRLHMPVVR